jgi:hypothetical protein
MMEALPVLLGFCFGGLSTILIGRPPRAAFVAGITGCIALGAVLISGEFRESWAYGLFDLGEAALGFAAASVFARRYWISELQK